MPGEGEDASALEAWFAAASDSDPDAVLRSLPELERLAQAAVSAADRDTVEAGERAWSRWWTRVERANDWVVPEAWRTAIERADQIIARAAADTAPVAAVRTLNEIAMDVLFVFRDHATDEPLTTEAVLQHVLYGDTDAVDYRGYLDRLAARALLGARWQPMLQRWRLSPLGERTLVAIREGVERSVEQLLPAEGGKRYWALEYVLEGQKGIPDDQIWEARYRACVFAAHAVGSCRARSPKEESDNLRAALSMHGDDDVEQIIVQAFNAGQRRLITAQAA